MNDGWIPPRHDEAKIAKWLAAGAVTILVLTNVAWLLAYSALSQKVVGIVSPTPSAAATAPQPSPTPTPAPPAKGNISGSVGFPAGTSPAQTVCAVSTTDASKRYCADQAAGNDLAYSLAVPADQYYVYASLKQPQGDFTTAYKAYYDKYVTCGNASNCPSSGHTQYVAVTVTAGNTTGGINPTDWYAQ